MHNLCLEKHVLACKVCTEGLEQPEPKTAAAAPLCEVWLTGVANCLGFCTYVERRGMHKGDLCMRRCCRGPNTHRCDCRCTQHSRNRFSPEVPEVPEDVAWYCLPCSVQLLVPEFSWPCAPGGQDTCDYVDQSYEYGVFGGLEAPTEACLPSGLLQHEPADIDPLCEWCLASLPTYWCRECQIAVCKQCGDEIGHVVTWPDHPLVSHDLPEMPAQPVETAETECHDGR